MGIRRNRINKSGEDAINPNGLGKSSVTPIMKKKAEEKAKEDATKTPKRFVHGSLKKFIIKEHATKVQNKLNIIQGEEELSKIVGLNKIVRTLKYRLPEHGQMALVNLAEENEEPKFIVAKVIEEETYGTNELYLLTVEVGQISIKNEGYLIRKEYKVNPKNNSKKDFIVRTYGMNKGNQEVSFEELNKLLGYKIYKDAQPVPVSYIPAAIFNNDEDGNSEICGFEEIFDLERQLLQEITRDLDLSRKKILFKSRLSKKTKYDLQVEMRDDELVVFEDGDAVFTSPIDLWSPALAIGVITECIDWLVAYALKMTFASRDSMSTGTNKLSGEVAKLDQAPNNYLDDKLQAWSETLSEFFTKVIGKDIEVEFQATETIKLVKAGDTSTQQDGTATPPVAEPKEDK